MDLRQLRFLTAIADTGTVTAAAASCHVAQPSLSQAIKALERELGVALLDHVGRGVVLTAAGRAAVVAARDTLRAADAVRSSAVGVAELVTGRLDLVALPTLAVDPLVGLIGEFRRRHPGVTVRVAQPEHSGELAEFVRSGASELGLTDLGVLTRGLATVALTEQEFVVVLPPLHRGHVPVRFGLAALAELPVVSAPPGTSVRRLLDDALASVGRAPDVVVEVAHREAILPLVLAGAGAALLPAEQAAAAARQGATVRRLRPRVARPIGLLHREGSLSPAAAAFTGLAIERLRDPTRLRSREQADDRDG